MPRPRHIERTSPRACLERQPGDDDAPPRYAITTPDGAVLHRDLSHDRALVLFDAIARAADGTPMHPPEPAAGPDPPRTRRTRR